MINKCTICGIEGKHRWTLRESVFVRDYICNDCIKRLKDKITEMIG